ncbi:FAH family protein [Kitasatospora sp. NPDC006697]|uniref:FAH family protein n=1 Tax=Kitasatospora sp. NPDC006697 TaxID=3364020 RepID=UPI00368F76B6
MVIFECLYRGERHLGLTPLTGDLPLQLHPLDGRPLVDLLPEHGGDPVAAAERIAGQRPPVTADRAEVRLLPPLLPAHPGDALVSGFMMTHNVKVDSEVPDQPTWFVKGFGDSLRLPGEPLGVPADAVAVCEEAEVVLVYVGDPEGVPRYTGWTFGNDLTDIGRFKQHAGHLSYAKLCDPAIAPALHPGPPPAEVTGQTVVERDGLPAWKGEFRTGLQALHYGLPAMTARLFAYRTLHRPGLVHYVYLGADRGSFHAGFRLADGDRVALDFSSHGVALSNPLAWEAG